MARRDDNATEVLAASPESVAPVVTPIDPTALIGRSLGKFTIVERVGHGGSGEVFVAEQTQLGRKCVIKVLRRDVAKAFNRVERFLREAKLASRLDHPYAAHVYAFGAEPDGVLWIAMEYVRGVTLDELVAARGSMPVALFAPLFTRLCEVIHTAHELGIVHRDIKASNVMVIERAGQLLPKLLDFGIAKGLDGGVSPSVIDDDNVALTSQGSTLGSPHYMAPEQWRSPGGVDGRADIYALGVLAYRCVSGRLPFEGIERPALPGAHLAMAPPPLPGRIPSAIADAIMRALAKQPDARWPTALVFADAIRASASGSISEAVPIFDPATRDTWMQSGPQPIADAIVRLSRAATTVEADAALRELVAITCRWLAVLGLSGLHGEGSYAEVRKAGHAVAGRDDAAPWLRLARAAAATAPALPGLVEALASTAALELLAERLDDRERIRTAAALATDIAAVPEALLPLEALLQYQLVVGRAGAAESWQGARRRDRERVAVWGDPPADGEVALLDATRRVVAHLSPLAQVASPLPSAEPELFLLWRSSRGTARLVAAPWGFERDDDEAARRLSLLTSEDTDTQIDATGDKSPYPGLSAYGAGDADRFVGREREVEALANRLIRAPMVAILGPSGAGKSSFIHAGVLPRLAEHYEIVTLRPGRHPLHALAALPPVNLDTNDDGIVERLRTLGDRAPRGLVIIVDQLEELVTLCGDPKERARFAEILAAAADDRNAPVRVVVMLRDDFATVIESEEAFRGRFEAYVLATPLPEALRRIVVEPARRAGVEVDPAVVEDMVTEIAGRPASLPLLSFTASQLWQTRDKRDRKITHESYLAIGGVAGALSTYADDVYGSLARRDQAVVRDLFSRLVATDGTRIPAPRAALEQLPGATGVLAYLIDARLLVVREDDGVDIIEIIHECLATRWSRLARWRSEDAADRALLGDVGAAARRWHDGGRRPDQLWRGEALVELRKLAARSTAMTDIERAFAGESDRVARRAQRVRRAIVVAVIASLAAIAVVMAYLGVAANRSRGAAERSAVAATTAAHLAEERLTTSLIAQGRRELNDGRALAALAYFGEAIRRGADSPGLRFMLGIAERAWTDERMVLIGRDFKVAMGSPTALAAGDRQGRIYWWDRELRPIGELATEVSDLFELGWRDNRMMALGRSGVAVIDGDARRVLATLRLENVREACAGPGTDDVAVIRADALEIYGFDGKLRRSFAMDSTQLGGPPTWGTACKTLMVALGPKLQVIDLVSMKTKLLAENTFAMMAGSEDGSTWIYVTKDDMIHVLDPDGTERRAFRAINHTEYIVVSSSGDRIGAAGNHAFTVYDSTGTKVRTLDLDADENMFVLRGDDVWTGTMHGVVRHYHGDALVASLPSHVTELEWLRLSGDYLLSISNDFTLVVHRADARQLRPLPDPCKEPLYLYAGGAVALQCPDGKTHVFAARRRLATLDESELRWTAVDQASQRAAIAAKTLHVFEPDGTRLITSTAHIGALAFEDADHLLVADGGHDNTQPGLWRWTLSTGAWTKLADIDPRTSSLVVTPHGVLLGNEKRQVIYWRDGHEIRRVDVGEGVEALHASADGRVVAAQLGGGRTVILDDRGEIIRRFEPADSIGSAATLDAAGDLVLRTGRGSLSVWDRHTGDNLLYKFELLRPGFSATFDPEGRIEMVGASVGVIDIRPDTRPVADVLRAIECRVPLEVAGSRLESRPIDCHKGSR